MRFDHLTNTEIIKVYTFLKTRAENVPTDRLIEVETELEKRNVPKDSWIQKI